MLRTTVGQLLINDALPEEMRDYTRTLDKKTVSKLMQEVADKHPDKYREIAKKLFDVGQRASYYTGGFSFGLKDMKTAPSAQRLRAVLERNIQLTMMDPRLSDKEKENRIISEVHKNQKPLEESIFNDSLAENNPLADQVRSGARGNTMNLKSLRGGDGLYQDHRDNIIPIPVLRSYSQGLSPVEYWAGTFGARKGVADVKFATQDAGFFSKQMNQVAHRLLVTALDAEDENELKDRGLPVDVDDADNEGGLLARNFGPYKTNTVITPKIMAHLKELGYKRILVRSPIVGGSPEGGVYARDVGIREKGQIAPLGDNVGIAAAQAISEPLSQSQLSSKHSGGIAGAAKGVSGFKHVNQLVQVPKHFKGGAAHAQVDGKVESITPAPAGGYFVTIGGQPHYVGAGFDVKVKRGDTVEAGDILSDGIPNPAEIVKHKGVGEGRRYFVKAFRDAYKDANITANRRNIELVTRGLVNHVRVTDEFGQYVPDDVVQYSTLERDYEPRDDSELLDLKRAGDKYLEKPVLHYTIGTKLRPSVVNELKEFGIKNVLVHNAPPPFKPEMIQGMRNLTHDPDWMTRMLGSNLQKSLLNATHRGAVSDEYGTSYVPGLAKGTEFGRRGFVRDWNSADKMFGSVGKIIP